MPGDEKHSVCEVAFEIVDNDTIHKVLTESKTVAVVGMSANPEKASNQVGRYLIDAGYKVFPVNPNADEIEGEKSYKSLNDIPEAIDIVDIFRPPKDVPDIVRDAVAIGAKVVWMQEGIVNNEASDTAKAAGLIVIMDRCMKKTHAGLKK